jgi:signal transduction histidine kinase
MRDNRASQQPHRTRLRLPYPFTPRLSEPPIPGERLRIESGLAWARFILASASLIAIYLDPTEPIRYAAVAYILLVSYLLHSMGIIVLLRGRDDVSVRFTYIVQSFDLIFPAAITIFTEGPNSPFFVVFFFAIMEAAFRWGFRASFVNSVAALAVQMTEVSLLMWGKVATEFVDTSFELNRLIIRVSYLMITGLVVGYAAEQEKQLRAEGTLIARLAERARSTEGSLTPAIHDIFSEMMGIFRAKEMLMVVREIATGRVFCWSIDPSGAEGPALRMTEPEYEQRDAYLFAAPADAWIMYRRPMDTGSGGWQVSAIDSQGRNLRSLPRLQPPAAPVMQCDQSIMGICFTLGTTFHGRVLLRDPELIGGVITELRFAQNMLQQVAPAIYNLYLVRRLRSRAGAIERARTARELHDGAIQSLIGAEMQVDVLRRRAAAGTGVSGQDLERIQDILRHEVLGLRELMQEMRPVDVGPRDLLEFLSNLVDRFRRDTGISARFVTALDEVTLSPRLCREMVRIAQEALFNVRRHSGAQNVMVRLHADGAYWKLEIEDDGRGFGFTGRMTGAEMDATHQGPQVIRERVRHIGGELVIESLPGRGAKLEIALPQPKARAIYA